MRRVNKNSNFPRSSIEKLSIQGIRSFNQNRPEAIYFFTPLTLIVGYNGSGKTTIIECLKYATTGELPTNSKMSGAFIHDPALCNEREVLAMAKLAFKSATGASINISRRLQLLVKKSTRQQKTLEGTLLIKQNGERQTISSKVADLDAAVPQHLGVSKAILDYVIFCHQDDSLWPLSSSAELKKRFDEIFDALKYTKAIENLKVLRKRQKESAGKLQIIEQHAKEDKDKGEKLEKRSWQLSDELDGLKEKLVELNTRIKDATEKSNEAWERHGHFDRLVTKLAGKRTEAHHLSNQVVDLKKHIKEMQDSDEELRDILNRYEERMALLTSECDGLKDTYQKFLQEIEARRRDVGTKQTEVGKFKAQQDHHHQQVKVREELIRATADKHGIRGYEQGIDEEHIREFMDRVGRMARDQNRAFEKARKEIQEEVQNAQRVLNDVVNRKASQQQIREAVKAQGANSNKKIDLLQADLDSIDMDEGIVAMLQSSLADVDERLARAKGEQSEHETYQAISVSETALRELESKKDQLDNEMLEGTARASESAQLDFVYKEVKERQHSLDTMKGAHQSKIEAAIGGEWTLASLEQLYADAVSVKVRKANEAESQQSKLSRDLEQLDFELRKVRTSKKEKEKEAQGHAETVKAAIGSDEVNDFPEVLSQAQLDLEEMKGDTTSFEVMVKYYEQSMTVLDDHKRCKLCARGFTNQKVEDEFRGRLRKALEKVKQQVTAEEIAKRKEEFAIVKNAQSSFDAWQRLVDIEIPALETEENQLEAKRAEIVTLLETCDGMVSEARGEQRDVEALSKTVQQILKYKNEVEGLETQAQTLSEKQQQQGIGRGLEQIKEDLKVTGEELRASKGNLQALLADRDRVRVRVNSLELETRDVSGKLAAASYKLKEKAALQQQVADVKMQLELQKAEIAKVDEDLQNLAPKIAQAEEVYDEARHRGDERIAELQGEAALMLESTNQLKLADQEIRTYVERGGPQELAKGQQEVEVLEVEIGRLDQEQRNVVKDINKLQEQLRNQDETKRAITDNLRYRELSNVLQGVQSEIAWLEEHNAEADKARFEREGTKWQNERSILSGDASSLSATIRVKDNQLKEMLADWKTDYKTAQYDFKKARIRHACTKQAVEEIQRVETALDRAIMKFHSLKMEEINRIIEELWKKTYQGTDVDTIVIRSEGEGKATTNRGYNYRVCMIKQDAEMDMRGRCSAGQKVLASIIIRLALAECFGVNCGLIALDEPTTNLDRDNIRALAESLAEIIRMRRQQSNFQLIVITHDEEFLKYMNPGDFVDSYWRLSRNAEMDSVIEKQDIGQVM